MRLPPRIEMHLRRVERLSASQEATISCINFLMESLMANNQDLQNEIDSLRQAIADDEAADQAVVDQLNSTIKDLQAKADAGFDTQPFIDQLEAVKATIKPVNSGAAQGSTGTSGTTGG